ncbi:DUF1996 domain-containing protein [Streptomyces pseudovenezuelae]
MLGGGGLVAANVYASATESGGDSSQHTDSAQGGVTVDCPDVGDQLTDVPDEAQPKVDQDLAALDGQIAEAYQRMQGGGSDDVLASLKEKRSATIEDISNTMDDAGERPQGLDDLAECTWRQSDDQSGQDQAQDQGQEQGQEGQDQGDGSDQGDQPAGNGPVVGDYADINSVQPNSPAPDLNSFVSKGTFTTSCGVNENGLRNSDNVIVAPGVSNGAHHFHDYIGNQSNTAFASDDDLANADTTCENPGDKSTYYWPVIRLQNGTQEKDAGAPGGGTEGNAGQIVTPKQVTLTFIGNAGSEVTAMPRLLRIITGDAKAFVNGTANANASWSCTGFEDRQLKDKYPLCPQGSDVVRTFRFQSCWDGRNIDSANHRTHVAFADASGNCPNDFKAIPQLVQRIVYDVDAPSLQDGGKTTPLFAVDSFPEQLHKPVTDHGDFINVFSDKLMGEAVDCINGGRQCGAGTGEDPGSDDGATPPATEQPSEQPTDPASEDPTEQPTQKPTEEPTDQPTEEPPAQPTDDPADNPSESPRETAGDDNGSNSGNGNGNNNDNGNENGNGSDDQNNDEPTVSSTKEPQVLASSSKSAEAAPVGQDSSTQPSQNAGGNDPVAEGGSQSQAVQGGDLAETGTTLWPAAAGTVLLIGGLVLLTRTRRRYPAS